MNKEWNDVYKTDLSKITYSELGQHIEDIKKYRLENLSNSVVSANEANTLLMIACVEKQSRNSSRIAYIAIFIALLSIIMSAIQYLIN